MFTKEKSTLNMILHANLIPYLQSKPTIQYIPYCINYLTTNNRIIIYGWEGWWEGEGVGGGGGRGRGLGVGWGSGW